MEGIKMVGFLLFNIILLNVRALEALLKFVKNKILIKGGNRNYITSLERLDWCLFVLNPFRKYFIHTEK